MAFTGGEDAWMGPCARQSSEGNRGCCNLYSGGGHEPPR